MARPSTRDPLDKFRWTVSIEGFTKVGFTAVSTPKYTITNRKYAEGGAHLTPRKIVDTIEYKPVILTRGVTNDTSFNKWATGFMDVVRNRNGAAALTGAAALATSGFGTAFTNFNVEEFALETVANSAANNGAQPIPTYTGDIMDPNKYPFSYRRKVKIEHLNASGQVVAIYILHGAFPIEYEPASDFDANADDGISIETLTLDYESFEVNYTGLSGFLADIAGNSQF